MQPRRATRTAAGAAPLAVENYRTILPLTHRFVEAAQQAGFPYTPDLSGAQQEGVGYSQMTRKGVSAPRPRERSLPKRGRGRTCGIETRRVGTGLLFEGAAASARPTARAGRKGSPRATRK